MDNYFYLISGFLGLIVAQLLKPFFNFLFNREVKWELFIASGSFPSSHTSFVVATTVAIAMREGLDSAVFALAVVASSVVMYDAMNVRYYAGKNIQLTQQIIRDLRVHEFKLDNPIYISNLKEILGHERLEVLSGFILGVITPFIIDYFIG